MIKLLDILFDDKYRKRIERVSDYLNVLQGVMDESERKQLSRVIGFSFSDLASSLKAIENELAPLNEAGQMENNDSLKIYYEVRDSSVVGGEIVPHLFLSHNIRTDMISYSGKDIKSLIPILSGQKGNALNILLSLDSIDNENLQAMEKQLRTLSNADWAARNMNPDCVMSNATKGIAEALIDKFDDSIPGGNLKIAGVMNWDEFIDAYIKYPKPTVEKFTNPLDNREMREKTTLDYADYIYQRDLFGLVKHVGGATEVVKNIKKYSDLNKNSYFGENSTNRELEKWFDRAVSYTAEESSAKLRHFMFLLQERICPNKLLQKVVKCTLNVEECNEFIKLLGVKNIVFILKNAQSLDPRIRMLINGFNDLPEEMRTEQKFLDLVADTYRGEQDKFCRLIFISLQYFLDFRIPKARMPKLPTINRYSSFYDQLGKVILNMLLSALSGVIIGIVDEILKCEEGELKFLGDNFGDRAGKVIQDSLLNMRNQSADFMITSAQRYGDIGGLEQETFDMTVDEYKSLASEQSNMTSSEKIKAAEYSKLQQAMSSEGFYDELLAQIGIAQTLRLYSGKVSEESLNKLRQTILSDIKLSNDEVRQKFAIVGRLYGMSNLEDELLSSAEELDDLTDVANREPLSEERKQKISNLIGEVAALSELANTSLLASAFEQIGLPSSVQDAIINSIDGNINPIKMAYDSDIELYKVATSEEKISKRRVKKVYFQGETITQPYQEDGVIKTRQILVDKTIINPEFESMVNEGYVPLKRLSDGTILKGETEGTKLGGYVEEDSPGNIKTFPGAEQIDNDKSLLGGKLKNSVGPYTDYGGLSTNISSPGAYAYKDERQIVFASGMRKSLGLIPETNEIGQKREMPSFETSIFNDYYTGRGDDVIITEEERRLLKELETVIPELTSQIEDFQELVNQNVQSLSLVENPTPSQEQVVSFRQQILEKQKNRLQELVKMQKDILQSNGILNNFENYVGKSFYGFQGEVAKNVITDNEVVRNFTQDPSGEGVSSPNFRISIANEYGTKLDTNTHIYLYREGSDPVKHTYLYPKSLDINVVKKYAPIYDENECDRPGVNPYKTNLYTPQENVFNQITREYLKNFFHLPGQVMETRFPRSSGVDIYHSKNEEVRNTVNQTTVDMLLKQPGNDYDDIYKNVFLIFFNKMRNSPLLQDLDIASIAMPGYNSDGNTYSGELPIALSFVNMNPTDSKNYKLLKKDPRIFNFDSIRNLVLENYAFFEQNRVGEENLDGEKNYDTNFMLAMKSVHPVMVARIYLLEHYLQSLVPTMELDSSLSEATKRQVLTTAQQDMAKNYLYTKKFADNTVNIYRTMVQLNKIQHTNGEISFAKAFGFFLEKEHKNVITNIKKIILKQQPECDDTGPFDGTSEDPSGISQEQEKQDQEKKLKNIFLDSLPLYAFPTETQSSLTNNRTLRISENSFSSHGQIRDAERFLIEDSTVENIYRRQENVLPDTPQETQQEIPQETTPESQSEGGMTENPSGNQYIDLGQIPDPSSQAEGINSNFSDISSLSEVVVDEYSQGRLVLQYSITPQLERTNPVTEQELSNYKAKIRLLYVRKQPSPTGPEYSPPVVLRNSIESQSFDPFNTQKNHFESGEFVNFATGDLLDFGEIPKLGPEPVLRTDKYLITNTKSSSGKEDSTRKKTEKRSNTLGTNGGNDLQNSYDVAAWQEDHDVWSKERANIQSLLKQKDQFDELAGSTFYRCYPLASAEGTIKELTGTTAFEIYEECKRLQQLPENSADSIETKEFIELLQKRTYRKLIEKLRDSEMFDIMFGYCFDINSISSVAAMKVTQSNANTQLKRMFADTKSEIRKYLTNIIDVGTDYNKDKLDCTQTLPAEASFNFGNFNMDSDFSSSLLKLLLSTPLYIYKGWSKTADPHVLITQTVVDLFETGFIIPKEKQINVEKPFTDPVECTTINSYEYPGDPIWIPGLTQLIAGIVTVAPWPFTGVPFIPTPYGLIYYAAVDPLLQLLEGSWRNAFIFENPALVARMNEQTGLDFSDIPVCGQEQGLLEQARQEQDDKQGNNEEKLDENSCPPALDIEFFEGEDC